MYHYSYGVLRNRVQAYDFFSKRPPHGNEDAKLARLSATGRGFQSTQVRALGAFNKSHIFPCFTKYSKQGMSVDVTKQFHVLTAAIFRNMVDSAMGRVEKDVPLS